MTPASAGRAAPPPPAGDAGTEARSGAAPSARPCLWGTCTTGLGNRLLMLAGALRIARRTGREFRLYWPVNENVGCPFDRLFGAAVPLVDEAELHRLLLTIRRVKVYNAGAGGRRNDYKHVAPDGDPECELVVLKCWDHPLLDGEREDEALWAELRRILATLEPVREVQAAVAGVAVPPATIGVHVRRDPGYPRFDQSRDEFFLAILRAVVARRPGVRFLVATSDPDSARRFQDWFGERLVPFPRTAGGRQSEAGMRQALAELLLLGRARAILGNVASTYSRTAALWSGRPLVLADARTGGAGLGEAASTLAAALPPDG